jgi:hypothetical protein
VRGRTIETIDRIESVLCCAIAIAHHRLRTAINGMLSPPPKTNPRAERY